MNPLEVKPLVLLGAVLAALLIGFSSGWTTNGWRLDSAHQKEMTAKQNEIEERDERIREQNRGVEAARAATASADERRKVAEKYAVGVIKRIDDQAAAVAGSTAPNCDGVLREAWENWK